MSDKDLFNTDGTPKVEGTPTPVATPPVGIEADTYLGLIVNEDGTQKYATAEEALKGSVHAQAHISTLEKELYELRQSSEKNVSMEEILKALNEKKEPVVDPTAPPVGIKPEDIAGIVDDVINKKNKIEVEGANVTTVIDKFNNVYGDKASETMYGKAKDLGFDQSGINRLIATNPTAALKLLMPDVPHKPTDPILESGQSIQNLDGKPVVAPETIMGATSHKDLKNAWDASKAATLKRLGIDELT